MKNYLKTCFFHVKTNKLSIGISLAFIYIVILPLLLSFNLSSEEGISKCHDYLQKMIIIPYIFIIIQLYKLYIEAEYRDILLSIDRCSKLKYLIFDCLIWNILLAPLFVYLYLQNHIFYISIIYLIFQQLLFMSIIYIFSEIVLSSIVVSSVLILYTLLSSFASIPYINYTHGLYPYILDILYIFILSLLSILFITVGYIIEKYVNSYFR